MSKIKEFMKYPNARAYINKGSLVGVYQIESYNVKLGGVETKLSGVTFSVADIYCKLILKELSDITEEDLRNIISESNVFLDDTENYHYEETKVFINSLFTVNCVGKGLEMLELADILRKYNYAINIERSLYITEKELKQTNN